MKHPIKVNCTGKIMNGNEHYTYVYGAVYQFKGEEIKTQVTVRSIR